MLGQGEKLMPQSRAEVPRGGLSSVTVSPLDAHAQSTWWLQGYALTR